MLAIVIPYYKRTFFEATLQSLAIQTDKRFMVYIGDDASPENSNDLLEKYKGQFEFMYHRFEENLGEKSLVSQWERCIALIHQEEWIMILGDDDVLEATVVASWHKNYPYFNGKSNLVRFASKKIFEESKSISDIFVHPVWENSTNSFYRKFQFLTRSSLSEYVFTTAAYNKYGFVDYPLAWNSDDRAWLDFSDNKPIFTINESTVYVRSSTLNITGRQDNIVLKNVSEIAFYKYLISNKFEFYNREQKLRLLRKYQAVIKKTRNLDSAEWGFLLSHYLVYFNFDWFKKGIKKVINTLAKKHGNSNLKKQLKLKK